MRNALLATGLPTVRHAMTDAHVLFGDDIEADHLTVGWGQKLTVGTSSRTLMLA